VAENEIKCKRKRGILTSFFKENFMLNKRQLLFGFLEGLEDSWLLGCPKLVQVGKSLSLAVQQPVKSAKRRLQKVPKMA
jgi:hypothetical protein